MANEITSLKLSDRACLVAAPFFRETSGDISAENTGITAMTVAPGGLSFVMTGTWSATVFLQFKPTGGSTWYDVASYTANAFINQLVWASGTVRLFVKTGGYSSGPVTCWMGQGV